MIFKNNIRTEKLNRSDYNFGAFFRRYGMTIVLFVMVILLSIVSPAFLTTRNLLNVVRQISIIAIIGFGSTMIIITGGIDLSAGSVLALVSVVVASLAHPNQYPLIIPILAGLVVGTGAGFINGYILSKAGIPPFISTLGMFTIARGLALLYTDGKPVTNFTASFDYIGRGYLFGIPFPVFVLLFTLIITYTILKYTKFGKYVYAIGGNKQAAIVSGINVNKYLTLTYAYAGLMVGISAIIFTSRISAGQPTAGVGYELDAITAAVIGGTSLTGGVGTAFGTVIGALVIGVLNNGLDLLHVSAYWQQILKGIIIIGAVTIDSKKSK